MATVEIPENDFMEWEEEEEEVVLIERESQQPENAANPLTRRPLQLPSCTARAKQCCEGTMSALVGFGAIFLAIWLSGTSLSVRSMEGQNSDGIVAGSLFLSMLGFQVGVYGVLRLFGRDLKQSCSVPGIIRASIVVGECWES